MNYNLEDKNDNFPNEKKGNNQGRTSSDPDKQESNINSENGLPKSLNKSEEEEEEKEEKNDLNELPDMDKESKNEGVKKLSKNSDEVDNNVRDKVFSSSEKVIPSLFLDAKKQDKDKNTFENTPDQDLKEKELSNVEDEDPNNLNSQEKDSSGINFNHLNNSQDSLKNLINGNFVIPLNNNNFIIPVNMESPNIDMKDSRKNFEKRFGYIKKNKKPSYQRTFVIPVF